jgi:hypothetical protein
MAFDRNVPKFSEEQLQDLSIILFDFLEKSGIAEENIPKIVVEIKYKLEEKSDESLEIVEPFITVSLGGINCAQGEGPGCGIGWRMVLS